MGRDTVVDTFSEQIGIHIPDVDKILRIRRVDVGERVAEGVGAYPAREGERYPTFVAALDADLNELGGIRLPDLTVPVGTHTGWNPRHATTGDTMNSNAALGTAKGAAADNSATWGSMFQRQVERCWKKPYGGIESQKPEAAFAIRLKRDGTLEGSPIPEGVP